MLKVSELSTNVFPKNFIELLPTHCETCGEENEVSESLTFLQCSNRKCPSKVEYRLYSMLQDLGIKGMGIDKCRGFLELFGTTNPYMILLYNPKIDGVLYEGCSEMIAQKIYSQINQKRGMLLWEFVKLGNYPNLCENAEKIFKDYTDLDSFYADLSKGGIPFLQKLLLADTEYVNTEGIYVQAVTVYETLVFFKEELEEGFAGVVILKPEVTLNLVFVEDINIDLLKQLRVQYHGKVYFNLQKTVNKNTDVVIVDSEYYKDTTLIVKTKALNIPIIKLNNLKEYIANRLIERGVE